MNDLFYEIIMQSSILITGLATDKQTLLYNLFLTLFGLFDSPELHIVDLSGDSSKYSRFSQPVFAPSDILGLFRSVHARLDAVGHDTAKPIYLYINNFDSVINNFYGKEKKEVMQLISDIVNRGELANIHLIMTADKFNNSLFSDFASRIYAGKCDKKTAQKYFGTIANDLSKTDCSDFGQALAKIDETIYKINIPEIPENSIDDIIHDLTGSSDNAPVCPVNAPVVRYDRINIKSHVKTAKPTETTLQPDLQATANNTDNPAISTDDTQNIFGLLLVLISNILDIIASKNYSSVFSKLPAAIAILILNFMLIPIKILCAVASCSYGKFSIACTGYMLVCAIIR